MIELLKKYEEKAPEIVFEWHDSQTEAKGWVVINSLRGGSAGGGTRMRVGLDRHEVVSLAKTMEIKFSVAGPAIGGAKSGINFDPSDPRKQEVLQRWYKAVAPLLKNYYGTGGDMNVDEIHEVIPITESCGVWHPQEGVFVGHYQPNEGQKIQIIGQLRSGVTHVLETNTFSPSVERKYTVADMITGYGVFQAINQYYKIWGGELKGKRAVVQGWGNVGAAAAFYLAQAGAKVVGIIDRVGGLIKTEGFSFEEITELFLNRDVNKLVATDMLSFEEVNEKIWDIGFEIFAPCAASRLVSKGQVERMLAGGIEVFSCGANVPFADPEIFFGSTGVFADEKLAVIPDFIANCGMARVFAYLMQAGVAVNEKAIFEDTAKTIENALLEIFQNHKARTGIAQAGFEIALKKLM